MSPNRHLWTQRSCCGCPPSLILLRSARTSSADGQDGNRFRSLIGDRARSHPHGGRQRSGWKISGTAPSSRSEAQLLASSSSRRAKPTPSPTHQDQDPGQKQPSIISHLGDLCIAKAPLSSFILDYSEPLRGQSLESTSSTRVSVFNAFEPRSSQSC